MRFHSRTIKEITRPGFTRWSNENSKREKKKSDERWRRTRGWRKTGLDASQWQTARAKISLHRVFPFRVRPINVDRSLALACPAGVRKAQSCFIWLSFFFRRGKKKKRRVAIDIPSFLIRACMRVEINSRWTEAFVEPSVYRSNLIARENIFY